MRRRRTTARAAKVEGRNLRAGPCQALAGRAELKAQSGRESGRKFVHMLATLPHERFELPESAMRLQIAHAVPPLGK